MHIQLTNGTAGPHGPVGAPANTQTQPKFRWITSFLAALCLLAGCSDDPSAGEKDVAKANTAPWLVQEDLKQADWDAVVKADADLQSLAAGVKLTFRAAGAMEDADGAKLVWAEFAKDVDDQRADVVALLQACDKDGVCQAAKGTYTAEGAELQATGGAISALAIGLPTLNKKLKTSNIDGGTVISAGLSRKAIIDPALSKFQVDNGTWGKRRLMLLNRFGTQMGVELKTVIAAAEATGLYDEIKHIQYTRRRDVDFWLPQLNALDTVVWFAAGVVKPYGQQPYRSVGMTVSRGVVGDEIYHSATLSKHLEAPPLGGPGLVILAGGDTLTSNSAHNDVLGNALNLGPYRPVVGIEGRVSIAEAEAGVASLLQRLVAGDVLEVAMDTASAKLGAAKFHTAMIQEQREVWKMPKASASFWTKVPKSAKLQLYVKVDPLCADVSGVGGTCSAATLQKGKAIAADQITPILDTKFNCDATFEGPYFECAVDNPTIKAKFWLKGLLTSAEKGGSVLVAAQGQSDGKVRDFAVVGAGTIENVDEGGGTTVLSFGGPAAGSTFWSQDGYCCLAKTPLLTGHASNLLSKLELKP